MPTMMEASMSFKFADPMLPVFPDANLADISSFDTTTLDCLSQPFTTISSTLTLSDTFGKSQVSQMTLPSLNLFGSSLNNLMECSLSTLTSDPLSSACNGSTAQHASLLVQADSSKYISPAFEQILKLPQTDRKKRTSNKPVLPNAISGIKLRKVLTGRKLKKEHEAAEKKSRKKSGNSRKQKRKKEKEKKKQEREAKKKKRERKRKEKETLKLLQLQRQIKQKRHEISDSNDSGAEMPFSDGSDVCSEPIDLSKCFQCDRELQDGIVGNWIGCNSCCIVVLRPR